MDRYSRQLMVIGEEGQRKVGRATVAVFGMGGLGTLVAYYLAGAGVGRLYVVDFDTVNISDLHRQVLYAVRDVGKPKVEAAAERLRAVNPHVDVVPIMENVELPLAAELADKADVLVDAFDNWASRHILNKAAVRAGKPLIHGAVDNWYGHVTVVLPGKTPCLHDLFGRFARAPMCVGQCPVLGPVVGIIASVMATETLKLILGMGDALAGRLLVVDAKRMSFDEVKIARDPSCPVCSRAT